jgi:hypothetical protein
MHPNGEQAGKVFLAANKARAGVTTLPSGLQYRVLEEGGSLKERPPGDGEAGETVVELHYYVMSISDICRGGEQSFYVDFYLDTSWPGP